MRDNKEVKVSVLMTVYNDGNRFLEKSIESVLKQTYNFQQFVIVNDGSTDKSRDIIKKYSEKDKRICFIDRSENKGRIYSLNEGLSYCKGSLIFINDADDISYKDRIESTINFYKNKISNHKKFGAIGSKAHIEKFDGENREKYYRFLTFGKCKIPLFQIYYGMPFVHSSCAYSREALNSIGGFPTEINSCIDYFTIVKLSKNYDIYGLNKYLICRNIDGNNFFMQKKVNSNYEKNLQYVDEWMKKNIYFDFIYRPFKKVIKNFILKKDLLKKKE